MGIFSFLRRETPAPNEAPPLAPIAAAEQSPGPVAKDNAEIIRSPGFQAMLKERLGNDAQRIAEFKFDSPEGVELVEKYGQSEKAREVIMDNVRSTFEAQGLKLTPAVERGIESDVNAALAEKLKNGEYESIQALSEAIAEQTQLKERHDQVKKDLGIWQDIVERDYGGKEFLEQAKKDIEAAYPNQGEKTLTWREKLFSQKLFAGSGDNSGDMAARKKVEGLGDWGIKDSESAATALKAIDFRLGRIKDIAERSAELEKEIQGASKDLLRNQMFGDSLDKTLNAQVKKQFRSLIDPSRRKGKSVTQLSELIGRFDKMTGPGVEKNPNTNAIIEALREEICEQTAAELTKKVIKDVRSKRKIEDIATELKGMLQDEKTKDVVKLAMEKARGTIKKSRGSNAADQALRLNIISSELDLE